MRLSWALKILEHSSTGFACNFGFANRTAHASGHRLRVWSARGLGFELTSQKHRAWGTWNLFTVVLTNSMALDVVGTCCIKQLGAAATGKLGTLDDLLSLQTGAQCCPSALQCDT